MAITKLTPLTTVAILRGVNVDPSYGNVMTHGSEEARNQYFLSKAKFTDSNAIPVRNNVVRVPHTADSLYDCNYIMWKNANFGSRWFFGFIRKITWINVNVSEIVIQEDIWETWQFEFVFKPCFVERHHVASDSFGQWLEPESFDVANRLYIAKDKTNFGSNSKFAIFYVPAEGAGEGVRVDGDFVSMCAVKTYTPSQALQAYDEVIKPLIDVGLSDNVIAVFVYPHFVEDAVVESGRYGRYNRGILKSAFMNLDGYEPANKKLLSFPYNSLTIGSPNGLQAEYRLEFISGDIIELSCYGHLSPDITIYAVINNYKNVLGIPNVAYTSISSGFPQCMFSGLQTLGFTQNITSMAMQATVGIRQKIHEWVPKLVPAGIRKFFGSSEKAEEAGSRGESMVDSLLSSAEVEAQRQATGDYSQVGSLPSSTTAYQVWDGEFEFLQTCIDAKRAKIYDEYLTRWGYSVNTVTQPNINGRQIFNFVKTNGSIVAGNVPQDAIDIMRAVLDSGVTFWHQERGYEPGAWSGSASGNPIL